LCKLRVVLAPRPLVLPCACDSMRVCFGARFGTRLVELELNLTKPVVFGKSRLRLSSSRPGAPTSPHSPHDRSRCERTNFLSDGPDLGGPGFAVPDFPRRVGS